jgi:hypothetical protein
VERELRRPPDGAQQTYSLRQYVRHAQLYGGYESVFEEARNDLSARELGSLCLAMRDMTHGKGRTRERFQLKSRDRDQLTRRLLSEGVSVPNVADLVGCSRSYVYRVLEGANQGPESPEIGGQLSTTEQPLGDSPCRWRHDRTERLCGPIVKRQIAESDGQGGLRWVYVDTGESRLAARMRRFNDYLRRLPLGVHGVLSGLIAGSVALGILTVAWGESLSTAIGVAVSVGIGAGIGSALGRDRASEWRRRFARRFAKPS